jgi:transposase
MENISTTNLDHLGLVAAVCKDIKLQELVDKRIGSKDPRRIVGPGLGVVAMVLNGLGFTSKRLYLTPQFFLNKPVERLLGEGLSAANFDEHALGRALDDISNYGASRFFGKIAFEIATKLGLLGKVARWDSTSFSTHGAYKDNDPFSIKPTYGYSKDSRPDLKQVMLGLVVTGNSQIPIWMTPLSGNSSDNKVVLETIETVKRFEKEIKESFPSWWTFDAAGFSADNVYRLRNDAWISRSPEKIKQTEELLLKADDSFKWLQLEDGYKVAPGKMKYAGVNLRLVIVYSEQAHEKECLTFKAKITKEEEKLKNELWHLSNQEFACEKDALKSLRKLQKKYELFTLTHKIEPIVKHVKKGRPKKGQKPNIIGCKILVTSNRNEDQIKKEMSLKGRFVLAANKITKKDASDAAILHEYKELQGNERGFRFLKDPWFMADTLFLKSPRRLEALMAVMTLCLLVYNLAQHKLRQQLIEANETVPNQKNRLIQNPTLRWVFQLFEGIVVVTFKTANSMYTSLVSNLTELRQKIIRLFGKTACHIYGLTG